MIKTPVRYSKRKKMLIDAEGFIFGYPSPADGAQIANALNANDAMREKLRATEEERDKWLKVAQRLFKMRPGNFIEQLARQGLNEEQLQNFLDAFELKSP